MGHMDSKDIFRKLGGKINSLPLRAPWNETFYELLRKLYSEKEADVVVKMPYGFSDLNRLAKMTKYEHSDCQKSSRACARKVLSWTYGLTMHITTCLRRL